MKKSNVFFLGLLAIGLILAGCGDNGDPSSPGNNGNNPGGSDTTVTFSSITANGSPTQTTTQLTLTFSQAITGLTAGDITLSGVSGVNKGTLSGSGPVYTLPISGFSSGGNLSVIVAKPGYAISGSPQTVTIYYGTGGNQGGDTAVTFNSVTANGSSSQTTTELTLTFSQAITGLSASDIALSGVSGVSKGTLSGSGTSYTLGISGQTAGGTLTVAVSKSGYTISGSPKTVTIYYRVLSAPTNVVAAHADYASHLNTSRTSIKITWDAVSGAVSYNVYRYMGVLGFDRIGDTTGTSYTNNGLNPDTAYSYYVKAVDSGGTESPASTTTIGRTAK
jgi:hypothetical protein